MDQNNQKIYCGSGKTYGQYGNVGISVCLDDIPQNEITTAKNGKRYVSLNVCPKKQVDQYGKTHYVAVNTWKPTNQGGNMTNQSGQATGQTSNSFDQRFPPAGENNPMSDVPF